MFKTSATPESSESCAACNSLMKVSISSMRSSPKACVSLIQHLQNDIRRSPMLSLRASDRVEERLDARAQLLELLNDVAGLRNANQGRARAALKRKRPATSRQANKVDPRLCESTVAQDHPAPDVDAGEVGGAVVREALPEHIQGLLDRRNLEAPQDLPRER